MLTKLMIPLLWCPACRSSHLTFTSEETACDELKEGELTCRHCHTHYSVRDGVPDLIPHDQLISDEWKTWEGHLDGFSGRRAIREKKPNRAQLKRWNAKQQAFLNFLNAPQGALLDIGCGPAGIREGIDPTATTYFGIDPIPTRAVDEFAFARAVAEYIPFQDETFSCLVARSALDHFCDLREFFKESARVLKPNGVMFIEQAIHGGGGLKGAIKATVHETKDFLDDLKTSRADREAPKHMTDFTQEYLLQATQEFFTVTATQQYTPTLLSATQQFIALRKK